MRRALQVTALLLLAIPALAGSGRVIIVNTNAAGVGFNDPAPATPVGFNPGITVGQQRYNVFLAAATHYTKILDTNVDIVVNASFKEIAGCTEGEGVLGRAAPMSFVRDFENAPMARVWYPVALANKFSATDLQPGTADVFAEFNSAVDNATCLGPSDWYYGLDGQHGADIDLYVVVLHELAHGLGFSGAASAPDFLSNIPSVFDIHTLDLTMGLRWDQMSYEQRSVSMINTGRLAWDGELVRAAAPRYLEPVARLRVSEPAAIAGDYDIGTASFGAPLSVTPFGGTMVLAADAADAAGPTTTDACSALTNAADLRGNVAVVDRGSCTFVTKARNAQAAGATALLILDNKESCIPPGMGNSDPADDITIPIASVGTNTGDGIRARLSAGTRVAGAVTLDPSQLAGMSSEGYLRLYAPCTAEPGSSVFHWDVAADPALLMEPNISPELKHDLDLTLFQLLDLGWSARSGRRTLLRR